MSGKVTDAVRNVALVAVIALGGVSPQATAGPAQWVPLAPPADTKVFVYGYARTGVQKDNSDVAVVDGDSSLGFAATAKLGDDLGAFALFEASVWTSAGSIVTPALWYTSNPTKFAYVGLKGSWGAMTLGSQWAPLAGAIGNYVDKSHYYGGHGFVNGQYRMSHSVSYQRCLDQNCYKALFTDVQMEDGDYSNIDRATVGGNWQIGNLVLGAAYQDHGDDDFSGVSFQIPIRVFGYGSGVSVESAKVGIARKKAGDYKAILAGGYVSNEITGTGWDVNLQFGDWWFDYSEDQDSVARIIVDYVYPITTKFAIIGEAMSQESDQRGVLLMSLDF